MEDRKHEVYHLFAYSAEEYEGIKDLIQLWLEEEDVTERKEIAFVIDELFYDINI